MPFPFGLRYAAQFLPFGLRGFMQFAWMSDSLEAKKVGSFWLWSDKAAQDGMDLEGLCEKCRITPGELIGAVVRVAYELRVDVSALIGGIVRMPDVLLASLRHAMTTGKHLDEVRAGMERIGQQIQRR